jgi:hypothetical protein
VSVKAYPPDSPGRAQEIPTVNTPGGAGGTIATQDEGISVDAAATTLNFVGAGVTATDAGSNVTTVTIPGGGSGAPADAEYVVMSLNGTLTNERRLQATTPIVLTDGGANADATLTHATSGVAAATYGSNISVPVVTFNATGHATSVTDTPINYTGAAPDLQGALAKLRQRWWWSQAGAAPAGLGLANPTAHSSGGGSAHNPATTGHVDQWTGTNLRVSGTAGTWTGYTHNTRAWSRGGSAGVGGFLLVFEFAVIDATDTFQAFAGFAPTTGVLTATSDPSALIDIVGAGVDAGDTNLQIMHNDGAGTATKIDLGASFVFQATTNVGFLVAFSCTPNGSTIDYFARATTNAGTVSSTSGTLSTNLPTSTVLLSPTVQMTASATAASVNKFIVNRMYLETPGY